ncbi:leucine rich repeat protein [Ichthyophthirius multifiliis]|uniref:Leucine rich repeat protein n=1 Tax=Ichthyophthirius multifiliis TaxID=5932 RepID=G0QZR4_ICHMU|nr:leucine rich repeat protein [Ichthyophthirius multifiliis]EGR29281.1 leucine rich repeat protein [Ichthyophthirius multifiliis]|eukprot:XP_004030517.1 leucine rich repeat protein [Ichthyophthirius multifiliis]
MSEQNIENEDGEQQQKIEEEPEIEQDDIYPPIEVQINQTHSILKQGLEKIGKISNGKNHSYTNLICERKNIRDLFELLTQYENLRFINFSNNLITDIHTITKIKYLTHLNLSNNQIDSLSVFNIPNTLNFLQELNLSGNKLTQLTPFKLRSLQKLNLNKNEITTCQEFRGHHTLAILEMRKNKLSDLKGIENSPNLQCLYVAENNITNINDLGKLPHLKILHLRKNPLKSLEILENQHVPVFPLLNYINFRECKFEDLSQMKFLQAFPVLAQVNVLATEMTENGGYNIKEELIMLMNQLKRINKEPVEEDEVVAARDKLKERIEEQERQRQEEEERKKQEEEERRLQEEQQQQQQNEQQQE